MKRLLMLWLLLAVVPAFAQEPAWPTKPVRWIVPFAPGGPADVVARIIAAGLAQRTGQPNPVENHPGAGGNIAHTAASKAPPDGHTLVFVVPSVITNPFYMKASIDPFRELAPVIHLDSASMVLVTRTGFPAKSTAALLSYIRANPGKATCGASGALPSVACSLLRAQAGDLLMVMYKGNGPALNAVMGGEIDMLFDVVNIAVGQVQAGRVNAIASTAPRRGGPLPDLPVMAEAIPGFELVTWHGVMTSPDTPQPLVQRINRELNAVLEQPEVRSRLEKSGLQVAGGAPDAFAAVLRRDYDKYGAALRSAGVKPE
jgi:tripartite-type tricarboxylate transporter receptor subunit TctC